MSESPTRRSAEIFGEVAKAIYARFVYVTDQKQYGKLEHWNDLRELPSGELAGDCVAEGEPIWAIRQGQLKAVPIESIKVGDTVLSYDLVDRRYCYEKVIHTRDLGLRDVVEVAFVNRCTIRVTPDHPMWARSRQKAAKYAKVPVSEIDLSRRWLKRVPVVRKLEYPVIDRPHTEDLCFVVGHFLAEGWAEGGHVCSSGHDIGTHIIPRLEAMGAPYSRYVNNSGVPCIRFLSGGLKQLLAGMLRNSFDMRIPDDFMSLPPRKLQALMEGYFLGDGHVHNGNRYYSTSCEVLAHQLREISLKLGQPAYVYKQERHGGVGTRPIYRVIQNANGHSSREYGYPGLSEASIRHITPAGQARCYDITVDRTATFVFANGILSHNCEDFCITIANRAHAAGVPLEDMTLHLVQVERSPDHVVISCGHLVADCNTGVHARWHRWYFEWVSERNLGESHWRRS